MQIPSYERLSDEASIKVVVDSFEKQLKNTKQKEEEKLNKLLSNYKTEEQQDIIAIYNEIVEFSKK